MENNKELLLRETIAQLELRNRVITQIFQLMDVLVSKEVFLGKVIRILEEALKVPVLILLVDSFSGEFLFFPQKSEDKITEQETERRELLAGIFREIEISPVPVERVGFMCFPIGAGKDVKGAIAAFNIDESQSFKSYEIKLFTDVSLLLRRILENFILISEMNASLIKMRSLFGKLKTLSEIPKKEILLKEIAKSICEIMECEASAVILYDRDDKKLKIEGVWGNIEDRAIGKEVIGEWLENFAYEGKRELIVNEEERRKMPDAFVGQFVESPRNFALVSIGSRKDTGGVAVAVNKGDGGEFSTNDLLHFSIFSTQISQIIEKLIYNEELNKTFMEAITALLDAVEFGSPLISRHSQNMRENSYKIAKVMGLSDEEAEKISVAALLHDVGKIGVPDHILQKKGDLNEEEWKYIKKHPDMGAKILEPIRKFKDIIPIIRAHHERWDGKGYPLGLKGDEIPFGARIVAVCDAFDAMTSERNYGRRFSVEDAISEIQKNAGTQFDPKVVDVAIPIFRESKRNEHF